MDKLTGVLNRLPQFYNTENIQSNLYTVIKAIVDELDLQTLDVDRMDDMIGIDSTQPQDLEYRWGRLLMIPRKHNESDEFYRARLKLSLTQLSGGTKKAIQYSIAVGMNINTDPGFESRINVYDAWDHPSTPDAQPGNIVCTVDLNNQSFTPEMETIVQNAINEVKASGINYSIIFMNYRVYYYKQLDDLIYNNLGTLKYGEIGR